MRSKIKVESDIRQRVLGAVKTTSHSANRNHPKPADLFLNSDKQDRVLKKIDHNATLEDDVRVINQSMLNDINMHLQQFPVRPKVQQQDTAKMNFQTNLTSKIAIFRSQRYQTPLNSMKREHKVKLSRSMISSPKHFGLQNKIGKVDEKNQRVVSALAKENSHFEKLCDEKFNDNTNSIISAEIEKNESALLKQTLAIQIDNSGNNQNNITTISIDSDGQKENKVTYLTKQEQTKGKMNYQYTSESNQICKTDTDYSQNFNNNYLSNNNNVRGYFRREQYQEKENGKYKDRQLIGAWQQQIIEKRMLQQQDKSKDNSSSYLQNSSLMEESNYNKQVQAGCYSSNRKILKHKNSFQIYSDKDAAANTSSTTDNSNSNNNGTETNLFAFKTSSNKVQDNFNQINSNNNIDNNNNDKNQLLSSAHNIFNLQRSQSVEQNLEGDEDIKNETANFKPSDFEPQNKDIKNEEINHKYKSQISTPNDLSQSMIQSHKPQTSQSISPKINSSHNYSSYSRSRNTSSHAAVNNDKISNGISQNNTNNNSFVQSNNTNNNSFIDEQQYQQQIIAQIAKNGQKNIFQNKNFQKINTLNQPTNSQSHYNNNNNNNDISSGGLNQKKMKYKQNITNLVSNNSSSSNSEIKGRIRLSPISKRLQSCQPNNQAKQKYNSFLNDLQELKITNGADSSNSDSFIQHNQKHSTINDDYSTEMTSIEHKSSSNQTRQPIYQHSIKKIEADYLRQNNSMCCDNRIQQSRKRINNSCNKQYLVSEGNQSSFTNDQYIYSIYANQARRKSDDHLEMLQISAKKFQQPSSIDYLAPDIQDYDDNFKSQMNARKNNKDEKVMQQLVEILKMQGYESSNAQNKLEGKQKFDLSYKYSSNDKLSTQMQDTQKDQSANDEQSKLIQAKIRASTAHTTLQKRGSEKIPKKQKTIGPTTNVNKVKDQENSQPFGGVFQNKEDYIYTFYNGDSSQKKLNKTEEVNESENKNMEQSPIYNNNKIEQQQNKENSTSQDIIYYQQQDYESKRKFQNKTQSEKKATDNYLQNKIVQNSSFNEFLNFNEDAQKKNYLAQAKMFSNQDLQNPQEQTQQQKYTYFVDFERSDSSNIALQKGIMRKQNSSQPPQSAQNTNTIQSLFNKDQERQKYGILYNKYSFNSCCNSPFQDNKISMIHQVTKEVNPFNFETKCNQVIDQQQQASQKNIQQQQLIKMNNIQNQLRHVRSISSHYQQFYQNNVPATNQNNQTFNKQNNVNNNSNYQDLKSQKSLWSDISQVENSFIKLNEKVFSSNNISSNQQQQQQQNNPQSRQQNNSQNKQKFPRDVFTPNVSVMRKKLNSNNQQ